MISRPPLVIDVSKAADPAVLREFYGLITADEARVSRVISINPSWMTSDELRIYGELFAEIVRQHEKYYFSKSEHLIQLLVDSKPELVRLCLEHPLLCYKKKSGGYGFEIVGVQLGKGSFGRVYLGGGTWAPDLFGCYRLKYQEKPGHVVKEFFSRVGSDPFKSAKNEYAMSLRTFHLHPKELVEYEGVAYLIECYLPGDVASKVKNDPSLTVLKRLEICIEMFWALKKQIRDRKVSHRDIKPDNTMIDSSGAQVNIFDLNLSKASEDKEKESHHVGTPHYYSYEVFHRQLSIDSFSDLYGMGMVLADFWGGEMKHINTWRDLEKFIANPAFPGLFSHPWYQMDEPYQDRLKALILKLTHPDKTKRGSIEDAISELNSIRRDVISSSMQNPYYKTRWLRAHDAGLDLRHQLYRLFLDHPKDHPITVEHMQMLSDLIKAKVNNIKYGQRNSGVSGIVKEFIHMMNVRAFYGLNSFNAIQDKMDSISCEFHSVLSRLDQAKIFLNQLSPDSDVMLRKKLAIAIRHARGKVTKKLLTIDDIVDVTHQLEHKIKTEIKPVINTIIEKHSEPDSVSRYRHV